MLTEEPCWVTRLYELFVGPENGETADWICRTRTLEEDFLRLFEKLEIELTEEKQSKIREIGPLHRSRGQTVVWDDGMKREVLAQECGVVRRFFDARTIERRLFNRWKPNCRPIGR